MEALKATFLCFAADISSYDKIWEIWPSHPEKHKNKPKSIIRARTKWGQIPKLQKKCAIMYIQTIFLQDFIELITRRYLTDNLFRNFSHSQLWVSSGNLGNTWCATPKPRKLFQCFYLLLKKHGVHWCSHIAHHPHRPNTHDLWNFDALRYFKKNLAELSETTMHWKLGLLGGRQYTKTVINPLIRFSKFQFCTYWAVCV